MCAYSSITYANTLETDVMGKVRHEMAGRPQSLLGELDSLGVSLYNKTMARPRKYEGRMTRTLTLRVPDDLYDFVVERAVVNDGDLSEATRDSLTAARMLFRILGSPDPHAALQEILDDSEREMTREAYFDEHGEYPSE